MALITAVFTLVVALLSCTESSTHIQQKTFTLEELVPLQPEFYPERLSPYWISDSEYLYKKSEVGLMKYNALTDETTDFLKETELQNYNFSSSSISSFSRDGKYLLLTSRKHKIYRYSSIAEYSVFGLESKSLVSIGDGPIQLAVWGSGRNLAYVQDNNVYYIRDTTNPDDVTILTTDGVPGEVYYGAADWIYEEEVFNAAEALWFSPASSYIAVATFNDTMVQSAMYPYYGKPGIFENQYPDIVQFKYPKAGRTNPKVGLHVYKLDSPQSDPWVIQAPVKIVGLDHILARVNWATDQNLIVLWMNRRQSVSVLVNCDLKQDKCNIVRQQMEPNGWIDISDPLFDKTGTKMVEIQPMYNGDRRFFHVVRFDFNSPETEVLSPGNSTVTSILGWDHKSDTVYYILAPGDLPWQRQMWATSSGVARCLSCSQPMCHFVGGTFSPSADFGIVTCSASSVPPQIFLFRSQENSLKILKDNSKLIKRLSNYKLPLARFNVLPLADDVTAHVKLVLPPEFNQEQKYPMIVRVYSGPGTSRVKDNFDLEYYNLYLAANRSVIVASIDVRGSAVMGVEAMHAVNTALGTLEITDTLAAIKRLATLYSFIDAKRIGVWGWSYGGFATTMMLVQDRQNIVACGAAVAPVTSWLYYDTIYTERYMDTPENNPLGYQRSDLTQLAKFLRGKKFLLIHGTGDDNVHYQHSLQLAKQLQQADIEFEQMSYTDENHSLLGVSRHFYHTLDHFWTKCFFNQNL